MTLLKSSPDFSGLLDQEIDPNDLTSLSTRLSLMTEAERIRLGRALTPRLTPYTKIGLKNKRQIVFLLLLDVLEVLFGGAAGGGKSIGLLAAASQFVDVPGYSALILRRRFRDLALPGALMPISKQWWSGSDARWSSQDHNWTFPTGAVIQFGYLEHEGDEQQYQSAAFQYIGFDELTQFTEPQYTYMFSRLRRPDDIDRYPGLKQVPLRMRGATNPGNKGHSWVKKRWGIRMAKGGEAVGANTRDRVFVASKLDDNPYLDRPSYEKSLEQLSALTRAQLRSGDWSAVATGGIFDTTAITIINDLPDRRYWRGLVRHWDLASQEPTETEPDPDYSVGLKLLKSNLPPPSIVDASVRTMTPLPPPPYWIILDVKRGQKEPAGVEMMVSDAAREDGFHIPISIEQERGSSGKSTIDAYRRNVVPGYQVYRNWLQGDKVTRAAEVAAMVNKGRVFCMEGPWVEALLDELGIFTGKAGVHDDQVDALSGAYIQLERLGMIAENNTQIRQHGPLTATPDR